MSPELTIRPMRNDDLTTFQQIDAKIFDVNDQLSEEFFLQRVQMPGFFALETKTGGQIGYLILGQFSDEIGHLGRIGVKKSMQSQGIGSYLMEFALNWFLQQEKIQEVQLYTQVDNLHAQGLYKKFGFQVIGQTLHYFVPFDSLTAKGSFSLQLAQPEEFSRIADLFPKALPIGAIRRYHKKEQPIYILRDVSDNIVGAARFTPSFPGCFPFELNTILGFDDFVFGFQPLCVPPSEFLRITYHENEQLAQLCETRHYKLHHRLFRMQRILQK
ncbi:MAG: GNAT family N-acetyltransferase [Promethearchaeota archaeon]